ncbi:hypothetical protein D0A40_08175 [Xanthomonas campestris pv. raphani]|nr:hypothetical protein D0A40_08175 [Xanthomonas campestris pv. raphani]
MIVAASAGTRIAIPIFFHPTNNILSVLYHNMLLSRWSYLQGVTQIQVAQSVKKHRFAAFENVTFIIHSIILGHTRSLIRRKARMRD